MTRTCLVTGATGGIGAAVVRRMLTAGDRVIVAGRDQRRLAAMAETVAGSPGHVEILVADLGRPQAMAEAIGERLPRRLDVLVHSAGTVELAPIAGCTPRMWQDMLAVNLAGPAELTRLALPALRAATGQVVLVNSTAGLSANAGWGAYAASKFGLRALADALRVEEAPNGVRVTTVFPGRTATGMQAKVHRQEGRDYRPGDWIDPDSVAAAVLAALDAAADAVITEITVRPGPSRPN